MLLGQSIEPGFAKGKRATLKLRAATINASIFDDSKNTLVIEGAAGINPVVTIKPSRKTLKNGKPVQIEGTFDEETGNLSVNLKALGPANLIPSGSYILIAKKGSQKLKTTFEYRAPTVIAGRVVIPEQDQTGEKLKRVLKYQTEGEAPTGSATVTTTITTLGREPIEGIPVIGGQPTLEVAVDVNGIPTEDPNLAVGTARFAQVIGEIGGDIVQEAKQGGADTNFAFTITTTAPDATGTEQTLTLSAVPDIVGASTLTNSVDVGSVNEATTVAANFAAAVDTLVKQADDGAKPSLRDTYNAAVEITQEVVGSAPDIFTSLDGAKDALALGSTKLYQHVFQDTANLGISSDDRAGIATDTAWRPDLGEKPITDPAEISQIPVDQYAAGLFDEASLPEGVTPPPIEKKAEVTDTVVPGSLVIDVPEGSTVNEIVKQALDSNTLPPLALDAGKATEALSQIKAQVTSVIDKLPIPPAVKANLTDIGNALAEKGLTGSTKVELAPLALGLGAPPAGLANIFSAFEGCILDKAAQGAGIQVSQEQRDFQFPPGFGASAKIGNELTHAFVPDIFAQNVLGQGDFGLFSEGGIENVTDKVLAIQTGRGGGPAPPTTPGGIQTFDPTKHASIVENIATNLGVNAEKFIGSAAAQLTSQIIQGGPTGGAGVGAPSSALLDIAGKAASELSKGNSGFLSDIKGIGFAVGSDFDPSKILSGGPAFTGPKGTGPLTPPTTGGIGGAVAVCIGGPASRAISRHQEPPPPPPPGDQPPPPPPDGTFTGGTPTPSGTTGGACPPGRKILARVDGVLKWQCPPPSGGTPGIFPGPSPFPAGIFPGVGIGVGGTPPKPGEAGTGHSGGIECRTYYGRILNK